ncbi:hypothetical protein [Flavobacterium piscis]|uniref:Uncharacterized protein n=1 Tax=Flavobacterium piscis TaxID=1114874 RepID=A0ABU1YE78_9FLAO|nr:hypothetical protein [Flavobacterium piscis]MDR7212529.1 hypothetical protein [Flavobacterium piscis]
MKTDLYTKIVLTVIAVCLSILTLQNIDIIPKTYAAEPNKNGNILAAKNYGLVPLNSDGTIDVNITRITTTDELDVNIDEIGGGSVSSGGPIPVNIKN